MTAGGMVQDARIGIELGLGRHTAWKRSAVVTDVEWVGHALRLFAWVALADTRVAFEDAFWAGRYAPMKP